LAQTAVTPPGALAPEANLTPAKQLVPVFNCDPPPEFGLNASPRARVGTTESSI
jgi:hypothetical protein